MVTDDFYIESYDIEECLAELPKVRRFIHQACRRANEATCSIEGFDYIYPSHGLAEPTGIVYRALFLSGAQREILVLGHPLDLHFESAVYLKAGRTSDQLSDVHPLIIEGVEGVVPGAVKDSLRRYENERHKTAPQLYFG